MIIQNGQMNEAFIRQNITLMKALIHDMEALLAGNGPTQETLEQAPVIGNWEPAKRDIPCLYGTILNHPLLGEIVPSGLTSQLWLLNLDQGWARTLSRFYRLGTQSNR